MLSPRTKSTSAFTLIELLVTIACVMVTVAIFLPTLARSKARVSGWNCLGSLKQIGLSFRSWAWDIGDNLPMQVSVTNGGTMELVTSGLVFPHFRVVSNELSTPRILVCPIDKNRTSATNFESDLKDRNLSYFINVDSITGYGSRLLCGDRNLRNKAFAGSRFVRISSTSIIGWNRDMHWEAGNIAFADGHVAAFTNGAVGPVVRMPAGVTNRLAVP